MILRFFKSFHFAGKLGVTIAACCIASFSCHRQNESSTTQQWTVTRPDSTDTVDLSSQQHGQVKIFDNPRFPIIFVYPSQFEARVVRSDYWKNCDSSLALGYTATVYSQCDTCETADSSLAFISVLDVHFAKASFEEIANQEGFERGNVHDYDSEPDTSAVESESWVILGRQGMRQEASVVELPKWRGLEGSNFTGVFRRQGGYAGLVDFSKMFLTRSLNDSCAIVASYSKGPLLYVEDSYKEIPFERHDFFGVVTSIKLRTQQ